MIIADFAKETQEIALLASEIGNLTQYLPRLKLENAKRINALKLGSEMKLMDYVKNVLTTVTSVFIDQTTAFLVLAETFCTEILAIHNALKVHF